MLLLSATALPGWQMNKASKQVVTERVSVYIPTL